MTVEVMINNKLAYAEVTDLASMETDVARICRQLNLQMLKQCDVKAEVRIENVPSRMNEADFEVEE